MLPGFRNGGRRRIGRQGHDHGRDRRPGAPACQPVAQPLAAPGQPGLDGANRAPDPHGGLFVGQTFEMAQDDRRPEPFGEPVQFLVELRPRRGPVSIIAIRGGNHGRPVGTLALAPAAAGRVESHPGRNPHGDPVKPARNRVRPPDRTRLPRQHEEHGLRGVLGIVAISKNSPAHVQDH